jgi:hypothetical protein
MTKDYIMIFRLTAFLLLSFLFVMSGNNAFASKPVPPHVCGGYNEEGETCAAVCQVGESAICISRNGANAPKCSCGPENGGQSLTDFLHKLKAVVKQEDVFNNNDKSVQMIENITLEVGTDVSPDGKLELAAAAICDMVPYTTPPSILCEFKIADPLQQKISIDIP